MKSIATVVAASLLLGSNPLWAATSLVNVANDLATKVEPQVIQWRRHFHQYPELSDHEENTAKIISQALKAMGLEVRTGLAKHGVVGYLKGAKPGPTVVLRADMDGLPVQEVVDLPFASKVKAVYRDKSVGVMHACGHDIHMASLLGTAQSLTELQGTLAGNVLFVFQPAEEGVPIGQTGGAELMLQEGLFDSYKPDVIFGFHAWSSLNVGQVGFRSGPAMASADEFEIVIHGKQTHGSRPWGGVDPIVVAAQVVLGVQTIASRQVNVTKAPSIISFGAIDGGIRNNIIPDSVKMIGTIRNFDMDIRQQIHQKIKTTAEYIAKSADAHADVQIHLGYPVMINNPQLTAASLPSLVKVVGQENVIEMDLVTGAEDFAFFSNKIPGFFYFIGSTPVGIEATTAPSNHSPMYFADEGILKIGVQTMLQATLDYLEQH